jgi:hypothetical protein
MNKREPGNLSGTRTPDFVTRRMAMINDDVVKCPLCGGFTHISKPELRTALNQTRVREQVERFITDFLNSPLEELTEVHAGQPDRPDFQNDVHGWNSSLPMWRRSPKE